MALIVVVCGWSMASRLVVLKRPLIDRPLSLFKSGVLVKIGCRFVKLAGTLIIWRPMYRWWLISMRVNLSLSKLSLNRHDRLHLCLHHLVRYLRMGELWWGGYNTLYHRKLLLHALNWHYIRIDPAPSGDHCARIWSKLRNILLISIVQLLLLRVSSVTMSQVLGGVLATYSLDHLLSRLDLLLQIFDFPPLL